VQRFLLCYLGCVEMEVAWLYFTLLYFPVFAAQHMHAVKYCGSPFRISASGLICFHVR
jgi:hypothetical protein